MKLLIFTFLSLSVLYSNAQTILYSENFESYPISQLYVHYSGSNESIANGASACGKASRGNASDFKSTNVDFNSSQNSSYFLGVNPESPCGGYYTATVVSDPLDFSGVSTLYLKGKYFHTTTLGWGSNNLSISFNNGTKDTTFTGTTYFSANDAWENFVIELSSDFIQSNVVMTIQFEAGEGVALDDIEISGAPLTTGTIKAYDALYKSIEVYPTLTNDVIHVETKKDFSGSKIIILDIRGSAQKTDEILSDNKTLDISSLTSGIYLLKIVTQEGEMVSFRIIKQ